jgi:hypothetical protein
MAVAACGGGPAPATAAAPRAVGAVSKPALPSASASASVSAPALATALPNPPPEDAPAAADALPNVVDPPAPELARLLARELRQGSEADMLGRAKGLPAPRDPNDNNPGSLVLSGIELAARELPAAVAHDRKHFAFVRRQGETGTLWLAAIDGNQLQQLFDPEHDKAKLPEGRGLLPSAALFDVQFSADDRAIYFQSEGWATSAALYRLELGQRQPSFVIDANGYRVLSGCTKRPALNGSLIAYRHTYDTLLVSAYDVYALVSARGQSQGLIGPERSNVMRFLRGACTDTKPEPPPVSAVPERLKTFPPCQAGVLRYAPVHFLDGTELPVFYVVAPQHKTGRLTPEMLVAPPLSLEDLGDFDAVCAPLFPKE